MFALKHTETGKLIGVTATSNGDAEFCGDLAYELSDYADNIWVVLERKEAEHVADTSTEWYNAGYSTPINNYVGKLIVVELQIKA